MIRFSTGLRDAVVGADSFGSLMNGGVIDLYDGTIPATPDAPPTGTRLGRITAGGRNYHGGNDTENAGLRLQVVSPGGLTKNADWWLKGVATGVPTWFRWCGRGYDDGLASTTRHRVDGSVGDVLKLGVAEIGPSTTVEIEGVLIVLGLEG